MAPDQTVARIGPLGNGAQHESVGHGRCHVLGRVHRGVGPAVGDRRLHFGDEDALAPDAVERRGGVAVARVRTTTGSTSRSGWTRRNSVATMSVWRRASGDPRVARRMVRTAVTIPWPRLRGRRGCAAPRRAARPVGSRRSPSRAWWARGASWPARPGGLVHLLPLLLTQVGQLGPVALELGHPQRLEASPQRGDDRVPPRAGGWRCGTAPPRRRRWRGRRPTPRRGPRVPGPPVRSACPCRAASPPRTRAARRGRRCAARRDR